MMLEFKSELNEQLGETFGGFEKVQKNTAKLLQEQFLSIERLTSEI
jgi:hypothetical protein